MSHYLLESDVWRGLHLQVGEYILFSAMPLALRGIRDTHDIDILVKKEVFDMLVDRYPTTISMSAYGGRRLQREYIEIFEYCPGLTMQELDELFKQPDIVAGYACMPLEHIIQCKQYLGREKDMRDIHLIQTYIDAGGI